MEYEAEEDTAEEDSHGGDISGDERKSNAENPVSAHSINDLPASHRRIIEGALDINWDIDSPRDCHTQTTILLMSPQLLAYHLNKKMQLMKPLSSNLVHGMGLRLNKLEYMVRQ